MPGFGRTEWFLCVGRDKVGEMVKTGINSNNFKHFLRKVKGIWYRGN